MSAAKAAMPARKELNMSAVPMAPRVFFQLPCSCPVYLGFSEWCAQ